MSIATQLNSTLLYSTSSWVELRRYKRAFRCDHYVLGDLPHTDFFPSLFWLIHYCIHIYNKYFHFRHRQVQIGDLTISMQEAIGSDRVTRYLVSRWRPKRFLHTNIVRSWISWIYNYCSNFIFCFLFLLFLYIFIHVKYTVRQCHFLWPSIKFLDCMSLDFPGKWEPWNTSHHKILKHTRTYLCRLIPKHRRSYSVLGPVSSWVGDCLWTGKPPQRRSRHPGLLSLSQPSVGRQEWVPGESWGNKQAYRVIEQPVSVVLQCGADAWLKGLASGDQGRPTGSGSALEVCYT